MLPIHQATRYVVPLREGGSLPAVVDTREGGLFVAKFRGAGQGATALVAEILVGALATLLDLPMPELALVELDESFGRSERDPEIQDVLRGSRGLNVGLRYLEGALNFDPLADTVDADLAARIVWLDALTTNLDRTPRNPNLMWLRDRVWLIDHGAALYFHHDWPSVDGERARKPFAQIEDHVLLTAAGDLAAADRQLSQVLTPAAVDAVVAAVPEALLMDRPAGTTPALPSAEAFRAGYRRYLIDRLTPPRQFVTASIEAQKRARQRPVERKAYRR